MLRRTILGVVLLGARACAPAFGGCSDEDAPPNLQPRVLELTMPAEVEAITTGSYVLNGTITVKDEDGTIRKVVLRTKHPIREEYLVTEIDARLDGTYRAEATLPLQLTMRGPTAVPGLELPYEISVVDDRGLESAREKRIVTFRSRG